MHLPERVNFRDVERFGKNKPFGLQLAAKFCWHRLSIKFPREICLESKRCLPVHAECRGLFKNLYPAVRLLISFHALPKPEVKRVCIPAKNPPQVFSFREYVTFHRRAFLQSRLEFWGQLVIVQLRNKIAFDAK